MCNLPSTYQRLIARVLQKLIGRISFGYLDKVIDLSRTQFKHAADLRAVLDRIRLSGLKLKPSKCSLFVDQVLYYGHLISAAGVFLALAKLRILADWPTPKTVREMKSFLGFFNFYGDYISDATELTAPLYDLTAARKGDESIKLTAEHYLWFEKIKSRLCAAPNLRTPTSRNRLTLTQTPRKSRSAP